MKRSTYFSAGSLQGRCAPLLRNLSAKPPRHPRSLFAYCLLLASLAGVGCVDDDEARPSRFGSDLHEAPAACGQVDYVWLDDDRLGDVLAREELRIVEREDSQGFVDALRDADAADVAHVPRRRVFLDRFRYQTQDRGQLVEATGLYAFPDPREVSGPLPLHCTGIVTTARLR